MQAGAVPRSDERALGIAPLTLLLRATDSAADFEQVKMVGPAGLVCFDSRPTRGVAVGIGPVILLVPDKGLFPAESSARLLHTCSKRLDGGGEEGPCAGTFQHWCDIL